MRAIDPDLDVAWLEREELLAVVQRLRQTPSVEATTAAVTREALRAASEQGYQIDWDTMAAAAYPRVCNRIIVFRIDDGAGHYRAPDARDLTRLERMAWKVRHRSAAAWMQAMDAASYEAERSLTRDKLGIRDDLRRDRLFGQMVSDSMAGLRLKYHVGGPLPATTSPERGQHESPIQSDR